ncbi:glycosyltransferase family 9 protein [Nannocystis bainbridge]|uniref:Glycosyltransferase family 9 protein n=1 Tax=Nannocystis bainbridge TaxID=2995303 RepID=A0ABT5DQ36_9BACT|nr:glycosyltransferase family 9 protein [Nannocystis bainbridge]MDC0715656.1 glycosyltransferase family 9 protein [Nannocystis bainbridge]
MSGVPSPEFALGSPVKEREPSVRPGAQVHAAREVLVLRALPGLGDFLCATPALRALRAGLPRAKITLLGLPRARELVARCSHLVDGLLEFPGFPGLPETLADVRALPDFLRAVQGRFDLALQMHGDGLVSNIVVQLLGARTSAGFYAPPQPCPDPATFLQYPADLAEPRIHLSLLGFLGIEARGERLEFPLAPADVRRADALLQAAGVAPGKAFTILHPGAAEPRRRVDPGVLAQVADGLASRGLAVVLTGSADEADLTAAVDHHAARELVDLVGRTDLGSLGALVERARLVIAGDTGISHLASALQTPSVVVFRSTAPARWAPLDRVRHRVVDAREAPASAAAILAEADAALFLAGVDRA